MKAFYITEPGKAAISDIPKPEPSADQVLLKVGLVGFCGSDLNTFRGRNPMTSLPLIPGHEVAATIEAIGKDVPERFKVGTNVTLSPYSSCGKCSSCRHSRPNACQYNQTLGAQRDGCMCEFITIPWQKLYSSESLTPTELALVEPLAVGFHAVDRGMVEMNDTVAVLGCGAVGLGAIAGASARAATVIGVDIDETKLAIAKKAGAKYVINSSRESLHEAFTEIAADGPDVIIEAVGIPETFKAAVEEVAFSGRVVYIGYAKQPVTYETKLFVQKELDIRGSRNALDDFTSVISLLEKGTFPINEVITKTVPLADAGKALADWDSAPSDFVKILVSLHS